MCPQNPLKLQLTCFMEFTPSAVGKTWLIHFLALRLKNKMSPTGQTLVWQLPESAQGCGWRPGSHRMFITPLCVEQSPLTYLLSTHPQASLCSCLCGSEGGMEVHKVVPAAALSKYKPKKCCIEKSFFLQTWGWVAVAQQPLHNTCCSLHALSSDSTAFSHLWSRALLGKPYVFKKEKRKEKKRERQGN